MAKTKTSGKSKRPVIKKKNGKVPLKKASSPAKKSSEIKTPPSAPLPSVPAETILVIGDSLLVSEYSAHLNSRQFTVASSLEHPAPGYLAAFELTNLDRNTKRENLQKLDAVLPPEVLILSSSVTVSATEQASWITHRQRLIGIGAMPSLISRPLIECAPTIYTPAATVDAAATFFTKIGRQIEIVQDRVGLVFPRLICRMINEAAFALSEEIAAPQDLDAAVKLGLNHPRGPVEWVDRLGLDHTAAVLEALERESGDPRYRMSPLLRQMALAGEWWKR